MSADAPPAGDLAAVSSGLVAALIAVDPARLGGVVLRGPAGPARDRCLSLLGALMPAASPMRRVPLHVNADRLLGGLDLAATLQAGRPIAQRGLLAEADGGVVVLAMAERVAAATAASVAAVLDTQRLVTERNGIGSDQATRIGVVALDEGIEDEQVPAGLRERLAFRLLVDTPIQDPGDNRDSGPFSRDDVAAARRILHQVTLPEAVIAGLCSASIELGIDSVRAPLLACRAACAIAALDSRREAGAGDAALAAALVLAHRATRLPTAAAPPEPTDATAGDATEPPTPPVTDQAQPGHSEPADASAAPPHPQPSGDINDVVLQATLASVPAGLLALLASGAAQTRAGAAGRAGLAQRGRTRGRPRGVQRGDPQGGARLNLVETLRAAAPWQSLRRRESPATGQGGGPRVLVRREDFHVWRFEQRSETTTVFVVDASGSAALHRLAETKGAVELLLADCYVRRDSVAVIAFRGAGAELLLSPTRSLVRAKRSLAGLPGGGGTPLASGMAAAHTLADAVRRRGATPVVVLLTDGRANIARDGSPGRARAGEEALIAARQIRGEGFAVLVLDTSPQPQEPARQLAAAMGARYLPLPHAGAAGLSQAVRAASPP